MIDETGWQEILFACVKTAEDTLGLDENACVIDQDIVAEVAAQAEVTLGTYNKKSPNIPKVAGHVMFWIRKLKPVSYKDGVSSKYLAINEYVGLLVGLALCDLQHKRKSKSHKSCIYKLDNRVISDWSSSMRLNSHSPHGTAMMFEIMLNNVLPVEEESA